MSSKEYGTAWDLEGTLIPLQGPETSRVPELKKDFKLLVSQLGPDHKHFLTTRMDSDNARQIANDLHIAHLFTGIYGREEVESPRFGKQYSPVAKNMGWTKEQAVNCLLAIGDDNEDEPADIPTVFIKQQDCYTYNAKGLLSIIQMLLEHGNGSYKQGFEKLAKLAHATADTLTVSRFLTCQFSMSDEGLERGNKTAPGIPTITIFQDHL